MKSPSRIFGRDPIDRPIQELPEEELARLLAEWLDYGHEKETIRKASDGLWIAIRGGTTLQVQPGRVTFHGEMTDDAIAAGVRHAQDAWKGRMYIHGPDEEFKIRTWAHAQIAGVEVGNYAPPPQRTDEANMLVSKYAVEIFNRGLGVFNDGILDGLTDDRQWGYRKGAPSPRDREMMRRVEIAMGLHRPKEATL